MIGDFISTIKGAKFAYDKVKKYFSKIDLTKKDPEEVWGMATLLFDGDDHLVNQKKLKIDKDVLNVLKTNPLDKTNVQDLHVSTINKIIFMMYRKYDVCPFNFKISYEKNYRVTIYRKKDGINDVGRLFLLEPRVSKEHIYFKFFNLIPDRYYSRFDRFSVKGENTVYNVYHFKPENAKNIALEINTIQAKCKDFLIS